MDRVKFAVKALLALDVCLAIALLLGGRPGTNDRPYERSVGYDCYKPQPAQPMPDTWAAVYVKGED